MQLIFNIVLYRILFYYYYLYIDQEKKEFFCWLIFVQRNYIARWVFRMKTISRKCICLKKKEEV